MSESDNIFIWLIRNNFPCVSKLCAENCSTLHIDYQSH